MAEGFAMGLMQGQESSDQHSMAMQKLAMGDQELQKGQLEITQLKQTQARQQAYLNKLATMNHGVTSSPTSEGPAMSAASQQANELAGTVFQMGEAAISSGMPTEGLQLLEKGATLQKNAAEIDKQTNETAIKHAEFSGNLMNWALQAPDDKEFARRWQTANMTYQATFGVPSKYADKPPDRKMAQAILQQTQDIVKMSTVKKDEAETKGADARTRLDEITGRLRSTQIDLEKARTDKLKKEGLTGTKKQQDLADAQDASIDQITDIMQQIDNAPVTVTGFKGKLHEAGEFITSSLGGDQKTPATKFAADVNTLLAQLPKALNISNAKYKQELIDNIANVRKAMTSPAQAKERLGTLLKTIQRERDHNPVPQDRPGSGPSTDDGKIEDSGIDAKTDALIDKYLPKGGK